MTPTFPICPACGGGIWPSGHTCPAAPETAPSAGQDRITDSAARPWGSSRCPEGWGEWRCVHPLHHDGPHELEYDDPEPGDCDPWA